MLLPAETVAGLLSATLEYKTPDVPELAFVRKTFFTGPQDDPVAENVRIAVLAFTVVPDVSMVNPVVALTPYLT